jgi:hypothetical protein
MAIRLLVVLLLSSAFAEHLRNSGGDEDPYDSVRGISKDGWWSDENGWLKKGNDGIELDRVKCPEVLMTQMRGRLGNRMTQVINALGIAELFGVPLKIPRNTGFVDERLTALFDLDYGEDGNVTINNIKKSVEGRRACQIAHKEKWERRMWGEVSTRCKKNQFWDLRCKYGFEHRTRLMQEYLAPHLHENISKCAKTFAEKSDNTMVIHLRGTDVGSFRDESHACHTQPECKVYIDAINRSKVEIKRVLLASDGGNPCERILINHYAKMPNGPTVSYLSDTQFGTIFDDACALLGAKNVIWARSGFSALFMMLNPYRNQVFLPLAHRGRLDDGHDYCDVWNLNHGICPFVKEGYFYYPNEWNNRKTQFDSYAGTCRDKEELGLEPLKRAK